jgi:hypothetical protein
MPTNPLLDLTTNELKRAVGIRQRIANLEKELGRVLGVQSPGKADSSPTKPKGKRKMSATARARLSAAAKARWKMVKARGGKSL